MAIFVASLFLPYTVNFENNKAKGDGEETPSPKSSAVKGRHAMSKSLDSLPIIPSTLAPEAELPRTLSSTKLDDLIPGPASQAQQPPLQRLPSATSLAPFTRTDTHSPNWGNPGKGVKFAQPSSRAKSPPPSSVTRHIEPPVAPTDDGIFTVPLIRSAKNWEDFEYEEFSIEPSNMGNGGLVAAIDAACEDKIWVGTPGMPINALSNDVKTNIKQRLEADFGCVPVLVNDDDMTGLYEQYCKTILWPHLHYQIPDHPKSKAYEDQSWGFYHTVNEAFAESIVQNWKKGDKIWIHDYHLMLVPDMVRKKLPDAEIGFFMHASFPSSEIFRCLPTRKALLQGILGANLVGLQTDEYARHFLQTCSRVLNVETTKNGLLLSSGRVVYVDTFPVGVDPVTVQARIRDPEIEQLAKSFANQFQGKRLIIARDKMDSIRGVRQKLMAYEHFLQSYPEYRDNVVLVQIATTTTEDADLTSRVLDVVTRIASSYSSLTHHPLVFLNQDLEPAQWLALLGVADCLMITSLREGMNLTGHEFILCQDGKFGTTKHSPLILSEFTGAAAVLQNSALLVNPWSKNDVAVKLAQALRLPSEEKLQRWDKMRKAVCEHDAAKWYRDYLEALSLAYKDHSFRDVSSVPRLVVSDLKQVYDKSAKRLLLLDYEGTLAKWGSPGDTVLPAPKRSADILKDLIEDFRNVVYVMSGRTVPELEALFSQIPGVGLIAENGAFLRKAGKRGWIGLGDQAYTDLWKEDVFKVLCYYQNRIQGSLIEELETCLVLKYDEAEDADKAFAQAADCANLINEVCEKQHVQAIPVEHGIFISDRTVNKAIAADIITTEMFNARNESRGMLPELVLVIGDSREDEYVFDWAHQLQAVGIKDCVTVAVGQRNTAAAYTVSQGVVGVLSVLRKLTSGSLPSP